MRQTKYFILGFIFLACNSGKVKDAIVGNINCVSKESKPCDLDLYLRNKVNLDSLIASITNQESVAEVKKLQERPNKNYDGYVYYNETDTFEIKCDEYSSSPHKTYFIDGETAINLCKVRLKNYHSSSLINYNKGLDRILGLLEPRIITVCGLKFLYCRVYFVSNGSDFENSLFLLYDLKRKRMTLTGNKGVNFKGFLLSDFNNDNKPELLVIDQTKPKQIDGLNIYKSKIKMSCFSYNNGDFVVLKKKGLDLIINAFFETNSNRKFYSL